MSDAQQRLLTRFMLLALATALTTTALKATAALLTDSVGLLSDALESVVNVVAALVALVALRAAGRPPDLDHHFGHGKAEYLSAAVEGAMVFVAATAIVWTSVQRLIDPVPLERTGLGIGLSVVAAALNLAMGLALIRTGREHRSITLVADGQHLLTDVWTSAGVLVGLALVAIFSWEVLDPIVAMAVGLHILRTGAGLLRRSVTGLLDAALPEEDAAKVNAVLDRYRKEDNVTFLPVRTRESGRQRFVYVTLKVPGDWSVSRSHALADRLEDDIARELPGASTFTHVEPLEDSALD